MNAALVPHVQESIRDDPNFSMGGWDTCIAHHVKKTAQNMNLPVTCNDPTNLPLYAMTALDVTPEIAVRLFHYSNWPVRYQHPCNGTERDRAIKLLQDLVDGVPVLPVAPASALELARELTCV